MDYNSLPLLLADEDELREACIRLRTKWLRLYLERRPYSSENIRCRAAICDKLRRWRIR